MNPAAHPLTTFRNPCKEKLQRGDITIGLFLLSANSMVAEACSTMALDWLIVDLEASPASHMELLAIFQSLNGSGLTPMVRVRAQDHYRIEQALDLGAKGILVPKIESGEMAARVAAACRYPPQGSRGINPVRASGYFAAVKEYLSTANESVLCMVQIESIEAVDRADEIAQTPGVDVVFIGCGDLASSLGQPGVVTGPKMDEARQRVLQAVTNAGKIPGIFAYSMDLARVYAKEGFRFVAIGNDFQALRDAVSARVAAFYAEP